MPVETFSDPLFDVGRITKDRDTYAVLCDSLGVELQGDLGWWSIDVAMLQRRASKLGLADEFTQIAPDRLLRLIETRYLEESKLAFPERGGDNWLDITRAYNDRIARIGEKDKATELLRFNTATALQLNKFTATWDEIEAEMAELGL